MARGIHRCLAVPGAHVIIFRRTFQELRRDIVPRVLAYLPSALATYNATDNAFTFYNGSILRLGYCATDADVMHYLSAQFDMIIIDEASQLTGYQLMFLRSRLRTTIPGLKCLMIFCTNPGGPGHLWLKSRFIDRCVDPTEERNYNPAQYLYIPARLQDNLILETNDPSYRERLESMPDDLRRAYLDGDWDIFAGQYFKELRRSVHGFEGPPPDGWDYIAFDYGESSPSAVYWFRVDYDGDVWVWKELYGAGYKYSELAEEIVEMNVDHYTGKRVDLRYIMAPFDIFGKAKGTGMVGSSIMEGVLYDNGIECGLSKADNQRIEGWRHMREFLRYNPERNIYPKLHVSTTDCPHFWRTVPACCHDPKNGEDLDTSSEDHSADAIRYGLQSRPSPDIIPASTISPWSAQAMIDDIRREQLYGPD